LWKELVDLGLIMNKMEMGAKHSLMVGDNRESHTKIMWRLQTYDHQPQQNGLRLDLDGAGRKAEIEMCPANVYAIIAAARLSSISSVQTGTSLLRSMHACMHACTSMCACTSSTRQ